MTRRRRLIADIGGTNARLAIADDTGEIGDIQIVATSDYETFGDALSDYLKDVETAPAGAAVAIAGPVAGGEGRLVNGPWRFSCAGIAERLGSPDVRLLNDLEAAALGVPSARELSMIASTALDVTRPIMTIGIGTGVGGAIRVPAANGAALVVPTEAGHSLLPPLPRALPHDDGESAYSAEDLLSGRGLTELYRLCGGGEVRDAAAVVAALDGESLAAALFRAAYAELLGRFAGNAALTTGARGGIAFIGGILPRLESRLDWGLFRRSFTGAGPMRDWLEAVPVALIADDMIALRGLASLDGGPA